MRIFIDVLVVPQQAITSEEVVETTKETYSNCWLLVFVFGDYLLRAWCCLEIAIGIRDHCKLTVIGTCSSITGQDFFEKMEATVREDIDLIKKFILEKMGWTAEKFNTIVKSAMEVLFVEAQKNLLCKDLFDQPRQERVEWKQRMCSIKPEIKPRDRHQDWEILTGNLRCSISKGAERSVQLFLSSTLTDTMLEWSFFLQEALPYLQMCARSRRLDLNVSDLRCGCREEDSLPPETSIAELKRCYADSAGLCCLHITGDKYGFRPIPSRIQKDELENLLRCMSAEEAEAVTKAYDLDENCLDEHQPAPQYVLLSTFQHRNSSFVGNALRNAARRVWADAASKDLWEPARYLNCRLVF